MPGRITLQTVADRVGVSRTTVSNAYNRPGELSDDLRDRILGAAAELGYAGPSAVGRMLRTGRVGTIGVVFSGDLQFVFDDPDTSAFLAGLATTGALADTAVTLLPVPPDSDPATSPLRTAAVDGHIVFAAPPDHVSVEAVRDLGLPFVAVDEPDLGHDVAFVGVDDRTGARAAVAHLIESGHRTLAVVLGRLSASPTDIGRVAPLDPRREQEITVAVARHRLAGYRDAMADAGLDPDDLIVWGAGGIGPDDGRRCTTALLEQHPDVTAVACFNDLLAIGACQAASKAGRRVPDDLSVVGFDDIPRASTWEPALTTVRQPLVDKGRQAGELLLEQLDGIPPRRCILPVELVVRSSTAAPNPR